ncbi:MAG: 5'-nucleotidase [Proteobacteria bacterium SW_6_67_9]|nr:MAG: 5'-nucleotidase [Proteobacteria bacterium SW_6_67_9]
MAVDLSQYLVVGISSRALFDLTQEDRIFREQGLEAYRQYQLDHESEVLAPGTGLPLVKALLRLNDLEPGRRRVEVVIMSRNSSETSLRIFNSISHYDLDITRAALTGGNPLAAYLDAFDVDLFLSQDPADVERGLTSGVASALLYDVPAEPYEDIAEIRIAFDGDSVLFSDEADRVYREQGLEAFQAHEMAHARRPLPEGPFAKLLKSLADVRASADPNSPSIRTALVTARNSPAHERVIRTLMEWGVSIDETFFLGGMAKANVLRAFRPHMYFDDQPRHCDAAAGGVPTGRVPTVEEVQAERPNSSEGEENHE